MSQVRIYKVKGDNLKIYSQHELFKNSEFILVDIQEDYLEITPAPFDYLGKKHKVWDAGHNWYAIHINSEELTEGRYTIDVDDSNEDVMYVDL